LAISFRENYDHPKKMRAVSSISLATELFTRAISTLEIEEPGQAPVNSGEGTNNNFAVRDTKACAVIEDDTDFLLVAMSACGD
jgi:hypothetical protein